MTNVTIGKAELKPANTQAQTQEESDKARLRDFLKNLEPDETTAEDMLWECLATHGYKETRLAYEHISQELLKESKALIEMLRSQMDKPANKKLKERWLEFNKKMGEKSSIKWESISDVKSKSEDILSMIRKRQPKQ